MKEKDTTVPQVFSFGQRLTEFVYRKMAGFDGDLVQAVINDPNHPFWTRLAAACDLDLTIPFSFKEIGTPRRITVDDGQSGRLIPQCVDRLACVSREALAILQTMSQGEINNPRTVELVFVYPNDKVSRDQVLGEFEKRGLEIAPPTDALRLVVTHSVGEVSYGRYRHDIVFLHPTDPRASLELHRDHGGIGLYLAEGGSLGCYAARRTVSVK